MASKETIDAYGLNQLLMIDKRKAEIRCKRAITLKDELKTKIEKNKLELPSIRLKG